MRRAGVAIVGAVMLAFSLVACSSEGTQSAEASGSVEATGTWGSGAPAQPQLVLAEDGTLSGTDGCNNLFGSWQQEGNMIDFGQVGSTLMYCEGVDTWLLQLNTGKVEGNALVVFDSDGNEIGTLVKQ